MIKEIYYPKKGEKTEYAGKKLGTRSVGEYEYKISLPEPMNREEFVEWFVDGKWIKIKEKLDKEDYEEFSNKVLEWVVFNSILC